MKNESDGPEEKEEWTEVVNKKKINWLKKRSVDVKDEREKIQELCHWARRRFYGTSGLWQRAKAATWNLHSPFMTWQFFAINAMMGRDVSGRDGLPLGDAGWDGKLLPVS